MSRSPLRSGSGSDRALSSSSVYQSGQQSPAVSAGNETQPATAEKTISCISCRGRKLKCDKVKPKCGTCTRLRHNICEYPERRRNVSSRRRNMKDLEARLAQVETKLVSDNANPSISEQISMIENGQNEWDNIPVDVHIDFGSDAFMNPSFTIPETFNLASSFAGLWSQDMAALDLQEPFPSAEMVHDLHEIYFEKVNFTPSMIHKQRYLASLDLPVHMQPPPCLRYAIWASAASMSDLYLRYEDILYERARKYLDADEIKDDGERFATVQYAQTCGLLADYEARKAHFTRAWMTIGRMVRLVQMLGLNRLDCEGRAAKPKREVLPTPQDFIELEERRRTFWFAFYGDRWSSAGTGWTMMIQEQDIMTNLPSSEESFESGTVEAGVSLREALTPVGVSKISICGSFALSACLFGHNFYHIHHPGPDGHFDDFVNGQFWKTHRTIDNALSNTFLFLPNKMRLPGGIRDMRLIFLHMNLHAASICLHQTAMVTAGQNNFDQNLIKLFRSRSLLAAEEITNIMRHVSHVDTSNMHSWTGFCLYAAVSIFIQEERESNGSALNLSNIEFLLAAMKALASRHPITTYFTTEVEIDIKESGILGSTDPKIGNTSSDEFPLERSNAPTTIHNLCRYVQAKVPVGARKHGPVLATIFPRLDRSPSPRDNSDSAPTSDINSTSSPRHIEASMSNSDDLSSLPTCSDPFGAFDTPEVPLGTPQYDHGLVDDFMFEHYPNHQLG